MAAGRSCAAAFLLCGAVGCASPEDAAPPPASPDEQRALAEARAMIPRGELPPETPATTESAKR